MPLHARAATSLCLRRISVSFSPPIAGRLLTDTILPKQAATSESRLRPFVRTSSSGTEPDLKNALKEIIPAKREFLKKIKGQYGSKVIGDVKVENVIGGMRCIHLFFDGTAELL